MQQSSNSMCFDKKFFVIYLSFNNDETGYSDTHSCNKFSYELFCWLPGELVRQEFGALQVFMRLFHEKI